MQAIHYNYSVAQATRLQFGLYCSTVGPVLHQESEASPQGGGDSSRCSSSNEAASRRHTLSCQICRLHGTNPPSAEREDASCAQTLPQRHRSDMHCFCGSSSWLAWRSLSKLLLRTRHTLKPSNVSFTFFPPPDLLSEEDLKKLAEITGCAARVRLPECRTTPNLNTHRTITSVCNNL